MIKLVVTDMDDTIIPESRVDLNPEYFDVIRQFQEKGVIFVIASGRQKPSILKAMGPVTEHLTYLAENGTDISAEGYEAALSMKDEDYRELIADIKTMGYDYHIMSNRPGKAYIEGNSMNFYRRMTESYGYVTDLVEDVATLTNVCKVSVFNKYGMPQSVAKKMQEKWGDKLDVCLAGDLFLDFMNKGCNKGSGLKELQKHFGVTPEETVAFGNADNDIPMLQQAKYSYAVANASENLKKVASEVIGPMKDHAVLAKMKEILAQL